MRFFPRDSYGSFPLYGAYKVLVVLGSYLLCYGHNGFLIRKDESGFFTF